MTAPARSGWSETIAARQAGAIRSRFGRTCGTRGAGRNADYLRSSADARKAYAAAKREMARVWGNDRPAYTEAKTDVILGILDQAEAWAAATGGDIRT